ncbi:hypothetical protein CPC08DRAFT_728948 [Agrocybe pediades]|nr:hypothetical protein CPC08DRAFT_728948 [Agrocybe pediades]
MQVIAPLVPTQFGRPSADDDGQGARYGMGQRFGPNVRTAALRTPTTACPECGLPIAVGVDSTLYKSQGLGLYDPNIQYRFCLSPIHGHRWRPSEFAVSFPQLGADRLCTSTHTTLDQQARFDHDLDKGSTMVKFTKHRKRKKNTGEKDGDAEKRFSYLAAVSPCPQQQQQHYSTSSKDSSSRLRRRSGGEDEQDSEEELEEGDNLMSGDGESGRSLPPAHQRALSPSSATTLPTAARLCASGAQGHAHASQRASRPGVFEAKVMGYLTMTMRVGGAGGGRWLGQSRVSGEGGGGDCRLLLSRPIVVCDNSTDRGDVGFARKGVLKVRLWPRSNTRLSSINSTKVAIDERTQYLPDRPSRLSPFSDFEIVYVILLTTIVVGLVPTTLSDVD